MVTPEAGTRPGTSLTRDLLSVVHDYLGRRRILLMIAGAVLAAGLAMNWSWLVAAGIAPILVSILPCVAMCALGLCMNRAGGRSCSSHGNDRAAPQAVDAVSIENSPNTPAGGSLDAATTPPEDPEPRPLQHSSIRNS